MNKKLLILSTALATILLVAIGLVLFNLYSPTANTTVEEDGRRDIFCAVPVDAAAVFHFEDLASLNRFQTPYSSRMRDFHSALPASCGEQPVLLSVHYSSKNQVSWLMVMLLSEEEQRAEVLSGLERTCQGVIQKRYDNTVLYRSTVPAVTYAVYGNYLLASTSQVILESSLRHLGSASSILDNADFVQSTALSVSQPVVYLNHENIGKLYSGLFNGDALGTASFAALLSQWSVLDLQSQPNTLNFSGHFYAVNPEEYYWTALASQSAAAHALWGIMPYNTHWAMVLAPKDFAAYLQGYESFLGAQNRGMGYAKRKSEAEKQLGKDQEPKSWFLDLSPVAVAVAEIPLGEVAQRVVLLQCAEPQRWGEPYAVAAYEFPGYLGAVLGKSFQVEDETCVMNVGHAIIVGSEKALLAIKDQMQAEVYFTWADYLSQTAMGSLLQDTPILAAMVNLNRSEHHLKHFLKEIYAAPLWKTVSENNLAFLGMSFYPSKAGLRLQGTCLLEQTAMLPVPPRKSEDEKPIYVDDTPIDIPTGPYPVKNFINGKQNWISQHKNHAISYQDHNRKSLWAVPFSAPIAGSVSQIDYFSNNKLQMAFAGGKQLCLLDRVGRWVAPFPVKLAHEVLLGPLVYDKNGAGEFRFLILHTDNTLRLYNRVGKPASGWHEITVSEKIRALPERTKLGDAYYWILRTSYRTLIYDALGKPVADFDRHELMPDSKCVVHSKHEVVVKTKAGKDMILNLKTGEFKRYK